MKKLILHIAFTWWLHWSRFYQWCQTRKGGFFDVKLVSDSMIYNIKEKNFDLSMSGNIIPAEIGRYKRFWEVLSRCVTWTADGPLQLWDVIQRPEYTIYTGKDDCDGFAHLAKYVFMDLLVVKTGLRTTEAFKSQGIWCTISGFKGHAVAVYKSTISDRCIMISNYTLEMFDSVDTMSFWLEDKHFDFDYLVKVNSDLKGYRIERRK